VYIAATAEDAEEILKLNGFVFASANLEITPMLDNPPAGHAAEPSAAAQETKSMLQGVLGQRYDGVNKILRLDALSQDPTLLNMGMFESKERAEKTFKALMRICDDLFKTAKDKQDAIQSISLADNNIDDATQVDAVAETFPDLKNLDLSGNLLGSMNSLARWKGKFKRLETLLMARNPVVAVDSSYANTLLGMFPNLQFLDSVQIRTPQEIAAAAQASRPKPLPQHGPDFRDANGIGESFLLEFFALYDTNRQALVAKYYDNTSQFSLAVDTNSVRDANAPPPMPWGAYLRFSRNLIKITTENARTQRLFTGTTLIYNLWKTLPETRHPDIKIETSKYIMDSHILSALGDPSGQVRGGVDGMIISVHGEFDEADKGKTGKRSFSRVFVLGPSLPGAAGPIRVVSDMLSLRANNPLPNLMNPTTQQSATQGQDPKPAMVAELSRQTGMTAQYSEMCLVQVEWDFAKALAVFNEKKVLPIH
jgi:nuclear RNA export factor